MRDPLYRIEPVVLGVGIAIVGIATAVHLVSGWLARTLDAALSWIEPM